MLAALRAVARRAPSCRSELDGAHAARRWLAVPAMRPRFPLYRSGAVAIPWLFRDPDAALLEWRARFNSYLHASTSEQLRLAAALADPHCSKAAAARIELVAKAKETQRRQIFELLAPLEPRRTAQQPCARSLRRCCSGKLPQAAGPDELLRQCVPRLGLGERRERAAARLRRASAAAAARRIRAGKVLTLGAGAGRLSYDFHRRYRARAVRRARLESAARAAREPRAAGPHGAVATSSLSHRSTRRRSPCCATARRPSRCRRTRAASSALVLGGRHAAAASSTRRFDTVLTPWYVDIIPQDFVDCVRTVNRLLGNGGIWLNTGSLAFFHRNDAWCYSEEETARDCSRANGFEVRRDGARRGALPAIAGERPRPRRARVQLLRAQDRRRPAAAETARLLSRRGSANRTGPCPTSTSSSSRRPRIC